MLVFALSSERASHSFSVGERKREGERKRTNKDSCAFSLSYGKLSVERRTSKVPDDRAALKEKSQSRAANYCLLHEKREREKNISTRCK